MPGWIAIVGLLLCPLIGIFLVGMTPWKITTRLMVGFAGIVLWIIIGASLGRH